MDVPHRVLQTLGFVLSLILVEVCDVVVDFFWDRVEVEARRRGVVILLDQFPRNMFRGDGRTHATDEKALETAKYAIERALDRELAPFQRIFLYLPFMHAEDVHDQRRSVELYEALAAEPGGPDVREYAVGHKDIVERFGRFPHRNAILGRETTPEEAEFLTQPGSSY